MSTQKDTSTASQPSAETKEGASPELGPVSGSVWLPIATAPMEDERDVLVWWRDPTGQPYACIAWYRPKTVIDQQPDTFDETDIGWWTYENSVAQTMIYPTHWMPLPPSPNT